MPDIWRIAVQVLFYAAFALLLGYFSQQPAYQHQNPDNALIKVSIGHAGQHAHECRRLSPEEIAKLAPNMRRTISCDRERLPLMVEIIMDGDVLFRDLLPPSGLSKDGESTVYKRFSVTAGKHYITARLRDSKRTEGFDYEHSENVILSPQQNFVIDFNINSGGFIFL